MCPVRTFHGEHNVECVLYSVDSTACQQLASLQLQDIEDTIAMTLHLWLMLHLTVET